MAVTTRIRPINRELKAIVDGRLSIPAQKEHAADFARKIIVEVTESNTRVLGRVPSSKTIVDGREGAPLNTVNPKGGTIVTVFELGTSIIEWIASQLKAHSPHGKTGRYADSHKLFADGVEVPEGMPVPPAEVYSFVNTVAYARKIEGSPTRKPESSQAPDGVYQSVAELAKQRYGAAAKIKFVYQEPIGGEIDEWARRTAMQRRGGNKAKRASWLRRQPAIIVTIKV